MKVKLNPMFDEVSGQLGEMVFRRVGGKTIAGRKPTVTAQPTAEQIAHRDRFKQAAAFGNSVMANSSLRALYTEVAKSKGMPVFALTVQDYFSEPVINTINLSAYNGQIGDLIEITASDEVGLTNVQVAITGDQDNLIETGAAVETAAGSDRWIYTATTQITTATNVKVQVVVTDYPGHTAVASENKPL